MKKVDKSSSAGTKDDSSTNAQVEQVSQPIAKPVLGAVLSKSTTINVEILKLEKEVPPNEIEDFNDWLIHKGIELGLGKQHEYYDYTDNVKDAIAVTFRVYCT